MPRPGPPAAAARSTNTGLLALAALAASFYGGTARPLPMSGTLASLGRALFFEPALSASGRLSCATCHDPAHAFGPPGARAVAMGGRDGRTPGLRAVPSLMYGAAVPQFTEHFVDDDGDDSLDQGPAGGRNWDGRAATAHDQARLALFSPFEMANENPAALAARVRRSRSAGPIARAFGAAVLADPERLLAAVQLALETFQQEPAVFAPYSSKYDAWLRHQAGLSAAEARGLAIFNDPAGGNCARCHPSAMRHGAFPQFTDFGYAALGVPRNPKLPANADPDYFDLGLCGPLRTDLAGRAEYCGLFRTPTLRNVATRRVFFHNGRFHRLEEVLHFYAGGARSYDDLPAAFRANLDRMAPFDRRVGGPPALDAAQIRDLIAFLGTLTDGYAAR